MAQEATADSTETSAPAAPQPQFYVREYRVNGNTVLVVRQIERAVYPFLGENKTIADVEKARAALEKAYHDAGYSTVFVDIPEQDVVGGVVRLHVSEGRISRLRVTGTRFFSPLRIREKVPALAQGDVPNLPEVQRQLNELNRRTGDRAVIPVLRPGKTPGTVELELKVKDEFPLHGSLEYNNRYSAGTTHSRLLGSVRYDNLFQREHSLALLYQASPEKREEVDVWSATYLARFEDSENLGVLYAVRSRSNIAAVNDLTVIGRGDIVGARLIMPLATVDGTSHRVTLGLDQKDFEDNILSPINYVNWSAQYNADVRRESGTTRFSVAANVGIRGLANEEQEFEDKRFMARPNYFYLRGGVDHARKLWGGYSGIFQLDVQKADSPLVSNEQFSAGGAESVRGYPEALQLGDDGIRASFELRTPSMANKLGASVDELQLLAFADYASLKIQEPLPDQISRARLGGFGVGMRATMWRRLKTELDWAYPTKDSGIVRSGDSRFHVRMELSF